MQFLIKRYAIFLTEICLQVSFDLVNLNMLYKTVPWFANLMDKLGRNFKTFAQIIGFLDIFIPSTDIHVLTFFSKDKHKRVWGKSFINAPLDKYGPNLCNHSLEIIYFTKLLCFMILEKHGNVFVFYLSNLTKEGNWFITCPVTVSYVLLIRASIGR